MTSRTHGPGRRGIFAALVVGCLLAQALPISPQTQAQTQKKTQAPAQTGTLGEHAARKTEPPRSWRAATDKELASIIPDRAPVLAERIETELRTASGITDGKGHSIAAVVLITAGYSANGKYSDFLLTQVRLRIGDTVLPDGRYLLGWTRGDDDLNVTVSEASSGKPVAEVKAKRSATIRGVQSIHIWPPADHSVIQLGRFTIPYSIP